MRSLDDHLLNLSAGADLTGLRRAAAELAWFGLKQVRACVFAGLFFAAVFAVPRGGLFGIPRYDLLLLIALLIQAGMLWAKLETWDEVKAITLFHVIGFALEVFKTSDAIRSWSYPDFAYTKVLGVPLFSGFMYAAVGSYVIQAWRVLDLRWYLAACALGLYARTSVTFRPLDRDRTMPLLASFLLIGFFVWVAENISTFFRVWSYPEQLGAWTSVHVGKWSSWSLLVVMTFTIVAHLKHIKARIHVPA